MVTMNNFHKLFIFVVLVSHQTCADPVVRNPIYETLDFLTSHERESTGEILSLSQTQDFLQIIWERTEYCHAPHALHECECIGAEYIFNIVGADTSVGLTGDQFEQVSVVLLYHLEDQLCHKPEANLTYDDYLDGLFHVPDHDHDHDHKRDVETKAHDHTFSEGQLHHILDVINKTYIAVSENKCFTAHSVWHDMDLEDSEEVAGDGLEELSSVVLSNLLHGECIGSSHIVDPDSFVQEIFEAYGATGMISEHDFMHIMMDLGLYTDEEHEPHLTLSGSTIKTRLRKSIAPKSRQMRSISILEEHDHENHTHSHCYTPDELLHAFDTHDGIAYSPFLEMCPSLVQMLISGACVEEHEHEDPVEPSSIVYLWATLAVFGVTVLSLSGIIIFPFLSQKVYNYVISFSLALAVSTLSGDALLHLLPEALGLHSHSSDEHDHAHEETTEPEFVLGKVLTVVGAVYVFFLFEKGLEIIMARFGYQLGHSHEHSTAENMNKEVTGVDNPADVLENEKVHVNGEKHGSNGTTKPMNGTANGTTNGTSKSPVDIEMANKDEEREKLFSPMTGMTTLSVMVLVGDTMHNVMDGLAIGVAFTLDVFVGLSTCIAILCHELPHELGDFVVLTKNGMTKTTAFFWVIMSNCVGLLGAYLGIALGSNEAIHQWIFAITSGFFLYVSLVDLMPEMLRDPNSTKPKIFLLNNIGLLLGWFILVVLAYFEEDIYNLF